MIYPTILEFRHRDEVIEVAINEDGTMEIDSIKGPRRSYYAQDCRHHFSKDEVDQIARAIRELPPLA